jgi:hypothetical protein
MSVDRGESRPVSRRWPARPRAPLLASADSARRRRYAEYRAFYEGQHWAGQARRPGRAQLVVNYARAIVDKGVSYLLGRGLGFAVEPPAAPWDARTLARRDLGTADEARAAAAEALLYQVYADNDLDAVDLAAATTAAICGDAVFKVFWDAARARLRVVALDPASFFARWQGDDPAALVQVDLLYALPADEARARYGVERGPMSPGPAEGSARAGAVPAPSGVASGASADPAVAVVETWTATRFRLEVAGRVVQDGPNPYGVIPFVHVPNLPSPPGPWGRSDLADVVPLNRELNERLSDQADVIRYHAHPPVVFRGVEAHEGPAVGPGSVWDLPRDADVKLLEWHGPPPAVLEYLQLLLRALYETSETPRTAFGDSGRLLSGVALETELRPLLQRTLRKRVVWSAALRRRAQLLWAVAEAVGLAPPGTFAGLRPRVVWPPLLPQDETRLVENNIRLVAAGLRSHQTAMEVLGVESPEEELARVLADRTRLGERPGREGPTPAAQSEAGA